MDPRPPLHALCAELNVHTRFVDGLGREVEVAPETLVAICASLGAEVERESDAAGALETLRHTRENGPVVPPVILAWDGLLPQVQVRSIGAVQATLTLEGGGDVVIDALAGTLNHPFRLPLGLHRLAVDTAGRRDHATVISAPTRAWRSEGSAHRWGINAHLAALRSLRSRAVADLRDLERTCEWIAEAGGDLVAVLPLLPTFNDHPAEPSPYSPVSRLFWSELILDLGDRHRPAPDVARLDVSAADAEVRAALATMTPAGSTGDAELARYAAFRGAQARLGRNWRDWPNEARLGSLAPDHVDPDEASFHMTAQTLLRAQLSDLRRGLDERGIRLGLDLAVGAHPDGYDAWSRQALFAEGIAVGAPPDPGFPSGQDWGFSPIVPGLSRAEGHRYLLACIEHQASLAGVLRIDHVMAFSRLYWIPHGFDLDRGAYVSYPSHELFALLTLTSSRYRCDVVGENLGTVPRDIVEALPRHRVRGMYLAIFAVAGEDPRPPDRDEVAYVGSHDTPTFVGWLEGRDIDERVRTGLLDQERAPEERTAREEAIGRLIGITGGSVDDPDDLLDRVLAWLATSDSPLVLPWLEDLWLEPDQVNLPGTRSIDRPNWQRVMSQPLDELMSDPGVRRRLEALDRGRRRTESDERRQTRDATAGRRVPASETPETP